MIFERYSFVALSTPDLERARRFWVDTLGCAIIDERRSEFFMVDAGGLRLCLDRSDEPQQPGRADAVIGLKVASLATVLAELERRGVKPAKETASRYAEIADPDWRRLVLTEAD